MTKKSLIIFLCIFLCFFSQTTSASIISSPFGWRVHPISGEYSFHAGLDIAYEHGTPISALWAGSIVFSGKWGGYGNAVIIEHENNVKTVYAHNAENVVVIGEYVRAGDVIAYVGSTGNSTGPHLHLEIWHNEQYIDPFLVVGKFFN